MGMGQGTRGTGAALVAVLAVGAIAAIAVIAASGVTVAQGAARELRGGERDVTAAVRATTAGFVRAWNADDMRGWVGSWTADATILEPNGHVAQGRAALEELFRQERPGARDKVETLESVSARRLTGDLAWADVDLGVAPAAPAAGGPGAAGAAGGAAAQGGAGEPGAAMRFHLAGLLKRQGGRWLWWEGRPYPLAPAVVESATPRSTSR